AGQTAVGRADPKRTMTVFEECAHRPAAQPLPRAKRNKAHTIEPEHPVIAADPEVTIARLHQRLHRVLRQPLLPLPGTESQAQPTGPGPRRGPARGRAA